MYVDQFPETDLSRPMAKQYGAQIMPTIEEALIRLTHFERIFAIC